MSYILSYIDPNWDPSNRWKWRVALGKQWIFGLPDVQTSPELQEFRVTWWLMLVVDYPTRPTPTKVWDCYYWGWHSLGKLSIHKPKLRLSLELFPYCPKSHLKWRRRLRFAIVCPNNIGNHQSSPNTFHHWSWQPNLWQTSPTFKACFLAGWSGCLVEATTSDPSRERSTLWDTVHVIRSNERSLKIQNQLLSTVSFIILRFPMSFKLPRKLTKKCRSIVVTGNGRMQNETQLANPRIR